MDTIKLWARHGDAVRQAIELGELVHLETASEELTDEFLLFAIQSGLLAQWANAFPDPRGDPEISMEVILASHLAARFAGLYSMRKAGYVLRSASVLGALGYSIEVLEPEQGLSLRGTSDDKLISGDVLRKLLVKLENKLATLRTLLDHAGLITQVGLCPIQVHDLPLCRLFFETAPVLRAGDLVLEDRGFVDGETMTFLKRQRRVDVIVPLKSTMLSYHEAVQLAELQGEWQPHPSRDNQRYAFVKGVDQQWHDRQLSLNA